MSSDQIADLQRQIACVHNDMATVYQVINRLQNVLEVEVATAVHLGDTVYDAANLSNLEDGDAVPLFKFAEARLSATDLFITA